MSLTATRPARTTTPLAHYQRELAAAADGSLRLRRTRTLIELAVASLEQPNRDDEDVGHALGDLDVAREHLDHIIALRTRP